MAQGLPGMEEEMISEEEYNRLKKKYSAEDDYKKWNLVTLEDIKEGEELTLTYTFYKI